MIWLVINYSVLGVNIVSHDSESNYCTKFSSGVGFVCDCSRSERTILGRFVGRIGWSDCDGRTEITGFESMRAAGR